MDLGDRIAAAVEIEVEPSAEDVLVVHSVEMRGDELAVGRGLVLGDGLGRDDAGRLDLRRDDPVLVEVPEEAVLVVARR